VAHHALTVDDEDHRGVRDLSVILCLVLDAKHGRELAHAVRRRGEQAPACGETVVGRELTKGAG